MPGTFSDSWKLTKTSFRLIREDRALLVFPVVAGLSILGVVALLIAGWVFLFVPLTAATSGFPGAVFAVDFVLFVAAYLGMVIISVYCTAALIGAATLKLAGRQPTAADGWRVARSRLKRLVVWGVISATVGLAIQVVSSRVGGVGGLALRFVGGVAWGVATYFMIPTILYESEGAFASLRRSAHLFRTTFGRTMVSNLVTGLLIGLGIVVALFLGFLGFVYLTVGTLWLGALLLGCGLAIGTIVALIGSAMEGVLQAALYRYATIGKIDPDLLPTAYAVPPA